MSFVEVLHRTQFPRPYLTDSEVFFLLQGTANSRYSKIKRLLAQGKLRQVRRGLYCLTEEGGCFLKPHPFELAQFIYAPSYISFESAFSFYNLIPEAVYTITSASLKRSKEFNTDLGLFSFMHLPAENFYSEVTLYKDEQYTFFIAKPWKAICDYIYFYKKKWTFEVLIENLRMDISILPLLQDYEKYLLEEFYQKVFINTFLKDAKNYFIRKIL